MNEVGIARPEFLLLLLCAPLLAALLVRSVRAREAAVRVFAGSSALSLRSRSRLWMKGALLVLAFVAVVIALAGPYVDLRTRSARRVGVDLVLAIDVSQSMATRDVQPDRLRTARHVAQELGDEMIGSRLSLVLFAGQGTIRYPATTDPRIVGEVLDNSGKGVRVTQGTSLAAAIASAIGAFPTDSGAQRGRAIVLVSDGEVTLGEAPDVATLQDAGIRVYTIGVGTPEGGPIPTYDTSTGNFIAYLKAPDGAPVTSKLDEASLQALASGSGGRYWRYTGDEAVIGQLASQLRTLDNVQTVENAGSVPDERSSWSLALAVVALIVERLLPDRRRMASAPAPKRATPRRRRRLLGLAIGSSLFWAVACGSDAARAIEDANARFASGHYQDALSDYRDLQATSPDSPQLSVNIGNTLHMLGDFTRALPEYAHAIDVAPPDVRAIAQYDRGNTLFRSGRLEDARDAYREALRLDPNDHDAKFNLEVVQRLIAGRATKQDPTGASGASGAPNASAQPGGSGKPGASGAPGGSPQPGQPGEPSSDKSPPTNDRTPGDVPPDDLRNALRDFRTGLTLDDALRVLDALDAQERGIVQLLEGQQLPRQQPQY